MCKYFYSESNKNNLLLKIMRKLKNFYILQKYIVEVLKKMEDNLNKELNHKNNNDVKDYLNNNIGNNYNSYIIPNIYFLRMFILVFQLKEGIL